MTQIKVGDAETTEVILDDPAAKQEITYKRALMTRSRRKEIAAFNKDVIQKLPEGSEKKPLTDAQEEKVMRAMGDLLNLILIGPNAASPAGDVLYKGWLEDRIDEAHIFALIAELSPQSDPT